MTQKGSTVVALPRPCRPAARPAAVREAPPAPTGLGPLGQKAWQAVMLHAPLLIEGLDELTVTRLCELLEERQALRDELKAGYLLREPIVSPTGKIVGERLVLNPALPALRALDRALEALAGALGITPRSRADLGLTLTDAELKAMNIDELMSQRYSTGTKP